MTTTTTTTTTTATEPTTRVRSRQSPKAVARARRKRRAPSSSSSLGVEARAAREDRLNRSRRSTTPRWRNRSAPPRRRGASPRHPPRPPATPPAPPRTPHRAASPRRRGSTSRRPPPDEAVMARRVKPSGGVVPGFASLSIDDRTTTTNAAPSSSTSNAPSRRPPRRPMDEYVPTDDELAHHDNAQSSANRDMHVVVLGHVDAGKSTLMGRVLHAVGAVDAKQQRRNERDAAAMGKALSVGPSRWTRRRRNDREGSPSTSRRRGS